MSITYHHTYRRNATHLAKWLAACCLAMLLPLQAAAQLNERYTKEHPLTIMGDWELPPYEFNNTYGEPTGFNVDVLRLILTKMNIPHTFILKEWIKAADMFEKGEGQLIIDPIGRFHGAPYYDSRSIIADYRIKQAFLKDGKAAPTLGDMTNAKVVIRTNDKATLEAIHSKVPQLVTEEHSPKEAIAGIEDKAYDYFIWGEEPLKWKVKELGMQDHIETADIDLPVREIRFASKDKELIDAIDDQFARLDQNGLLDAVRDKWFHPERVHNDTSPMVVFVTVGIMLLSIGLWLLIRIVIRRLKNVTRRSEDMEQMMRKALSMGNYVVTLYDVRTERFENRHGHLLPTEGMNMSEFTSHVHPDDQSTFTTEMERLKQGENINWEMDIRWNKGTTDKQDWIYIHGHAIAEKNEKGQIKYILSTVKDVTEEFEQERKDSELANKYIKLFESTLVGISFYDKSGKLIDLNKNMRLLCGFDKEGEAFFRNTNMFEVPLFKDDLDPQNPHQVHACQHMYYNEAGLDKYIEFRILPTFNEGVLQFYVITARDITDEREMYMEQYLHDKELHKTNAMINQYEEELQYLLENCDMYVWRSDINTQQIHFSRSLRNNDFTMTFQDFVDSIYNDEKKAHAMELFNQMKGTDNNFNITVHLMHTPASTKPQWMAISGIPTFDEAGNPKGHFGIVRDVTVLIEAQERLKRETSRAEDSGRLKSMFLANMTHEIRTPLNAIVGFSDLLQVIDEPSERQEFIRIIRNNCDMLIRLINDIIEASSINQGTLAIEASDVDFAIAFNDICQTLAQRVQEPGVEFLVDNPYESFKTRLDKGRLQQVITNFTTNAVKYTHQGHIKVGYRYIQEQELVAMTGIDTLKDPLQKGIYMYCEDTGAGIPKEKQLMVFERFVKLNDYVQGTGLGLSICKNIADCCGGHIGVTSQGEGKGSTFWIWIPCQQFNDNNN